MMKLQALAALRKPLLSAFLGAAIGGSGSASPAPAIENAPSSTPALPMYEADVRTSTVQGIPMDDAMMATYAAYYIGANASDPTVKPVSHANADLDGRATNVFDMEKPLDQYFGKPDSPFLVLDDSNRWNERNGRESLSAQRDKMGGGYFVTLYHKASGQIVIAAPGLEGDTPGSGTNNISQTFMGLASRGANDYGDVLFNAEDAYKGSTFLRMSRAMKDYIGELDSDLKAGSISVDDNGQTRTLGYAPGEDIRDRIVLAGHSAGTIPAMTLSGIGFKSFVVEPRAYNANLEHRMMRNLAYMSEGVDRSTFRANIQENQTSLRASWGNVWTSGLSTNGRYNGETLGKNYVAHRLGTEKDTMIGGTHREEVMTPGLLGITGAKGYKGDVVLIGDALPGPEARSFGESLKFRSVRAGASNTPALNTF